MAITHFAHEWLRRYIEDAVRRGFAPKGTAKNAVVLTSRQQRGLTALLKVQWGAHYSCPARLDIKPQHGYRSRVEKDGFLPDDYLEWLVAGCSDVAEVDAQSNGRPYLIVPDVFGRWATTFDLIVPITSDHFGYVHVFDVIPKGLRARKA